MKKYLIEGMNCSSCSFHIEKIVQKLPNIESVQVNFLTKELIIEGQVDESLLLELIRKAGYNLVNHKTKFNYQFIITTMLFIFILLFSMSSMYLNIIWLNPLMFILIQLLISLIVIFLNFHLIQRFISALFKKEIIMESLISISIIISLFYSLYNSYLVIFNHQLHLIHYLYYEAIVTIIALVNIGFKIQELLIDKTKNQISSLIAYRPKMCLKYQDGNLISVVVDSLVINDLIKVQAGDIIPLDGKIVEGKLLVDNSILNGESKVKLYQQDQEVILGAKVIDGEAKLQVTKLASDSFYQNMIDKISQISANKTKTAKLIDRVANIFLKLILVIAVLSISYHLFIGSSFNILITAVINLLVIACPCALGLAYPLAMWIASFRASKSELLLQNNNFFERGQKINLVAFDKTGTLTEDKLVVKDYLLENIDIDYLKKVIYNLELGVSHPIAKSLIEEFSIPSYDLQVESYQNMIGKGIKAMVDGDEYIIASEKYLVDKLSLSNHAQEYLKTYRDDTKILIAKNNFLVAIIVLESKIKTSAYQLVKKLHELKLKTLIISGDSEYPTAKVANSLGIKQYYYHQSPEDKFKLIDQLSKQYSVLMIGDGINDAMVLSRADLSVAMNKASDIAISSSDILLNSDDLTKIIDLLMMIKDTKKYILANLIYAFIYNIICIPIAFGLFPKLQFNPMIASLLMTLSTISILTYTLFTLWRIKNAKNN